MTSRRLETGNVLLIILIGIFLFAALGYTFSRTSRSVGTVSTEDAQIYARQILSYAEKVDGAVQNVMFQNGCLDTQISFENATVAGYANAGAPGNKKCHVFDLAGGGMNYEAPPDKALDTVAAAASAFLAGGLVGDYFFTGNICMDGVGTGGGGTCTTDGVLNEELVMILPWIKPEVCTVINDILMRGAAAVVNPYVVDPGFDDTKFTGSYADGFMFANGGRAAGCYETQAGTSPDAGYHFYRVLVTH